jgi:hypothetical protein
VKWFVKAHGAVFVLVQVSILSERRVHAPRGLAGGKDGARGKNLLLKRDGRYLYLGGPKFFSYFQKAYLGGYFGWVFASSKLALVYHIFSVLIVCLNSSFEHKAWNFIFYSHLISHMSCPKP